jgi:hypothetical protein
MSGCYTDVSQFGTAILNAKAIGRCEAVHDVMNLDYETFCMELGYEPKQREPEER